jgi:hypothetical protein
MANAYNPQNSTSTAGMFADPSNELQREIEERRRKMFAAGNPTLGGTPGASRIGNMMGFGGYGAGNISGSPF